MTRSTGHRFHRSELAHGADHVLIPSAIYADAAGSSFTARFGSEAGLSAFLDMVLRYPGKTSTVRMFLKPKGYAPPEDAPPEFLPSSLYFDLDQQQGIAAAAMLVFDAHGASHQWLTQGDLGCDDLPLIMDPFNPEFARFPQESFIPVSQLRDAVVQWAFGDNLPPSVLVWRPATEDEVGWPVGAGY